MKSHHLYCLFLILLLHFAMTAQESNHYPTSYFRHPIQLPVSLAGDFAEIRSNHFHSGLDLRTDGKEGVKVYAPADGYVSRINISAWGGGKVLYITHPNGYRTVYMHLSAFCGDIGEFVHNYQYSHHIFAFDIEIPKDSILVKQGQLIALTGNSGGSAGPHLHYEIRYAENDQTINPLYFGISYTDPIAPTIAGVKLYPANSNTSINGKNQELKVPEGETVTIAGRFYTGIYAYDQMEPKSRNKNGVEKIELFVDGTLFHRYQVPTFMFEETRAINAIIDYPQYNRNREYYIITRHLHGDRNNFSTAFRDFGYLQFDDNDMHRLEYKVSDYKGNVTSRIILVKSNPSALITGNDSQLGPVQATGEPIAYYKPFSLITDNFQVLIEANTIYDNDEILYSTMNDMDYLSKLHKLTLKRHPLPPHKSFTVKIAIPQNIPSTLKEKLTIVCINGNKLSALPTTKEDRFLSATTRSFGGFAIRLDTIPPTIRPINFSNNKPFVAKHLTVKMSDDLSGVVSYNCYVNGSWQLAEHDGKTSTLNVASSTLRKGKNEVTFVLTDAVGNETKQTFYITNN